MFAWFKTALASIALLSVAASCLAAQPAASLIDGGRSATYEPDYAPLAEAPCGPSHSCGHGCRGCNGFHHHHFATRCNLIPHIAYINPLSSYYYFRPYQGFHVRAQQAEVISYGADPRQPYANLMFKAIYPELEAAWAEEVRNNTSPFEDDMTQEAAPTVEELEPQEPSADDRDASTQPSESQPARLQLTPATHLDKPENNTAALPAAPHEIRTRR